MHTFVLFSARHHLVGKVVGRFTRVQGTVTVTDDLAESSVSVYRASRSCAQLTHSIRRWPISPEAQRNGRTRMRPSFVSNRIRMTGVMDRREWQLVRSHGC